ncbi:unnamed protein product [Vicia faba]|uniref:Protein kinase domain-containing protein n=1 Tax=Vicia faba TaxID=3906 RepID=A0AAV1AI15_VICFA|nr:unnamed protein product [Vicia faba]
MDWVRGESVGRGTFATVHLVLPKGSSNSTLFPSPTAVKSSEVSTSYSLKNERHVLDCLGSCQQIIRCFGDDYTFENSHEYYNLFLEYASAGTLADQAKFHGGRIPEQNIRGYTRSIVEGEEQSRLECRGTPLFMSPESVNNGEYESAADIWALGCAVVEMVTGKPAWSLEKDSSMWSLLLRIGGGEESPMIPQDLSKEGKDFVEKCFVKDPRKRWTAEMLLSHPFIEEVKNGNEASPRNHFDFNDWVSSVSRSTPSSPEFEESCQRNFDAYSFSGVDRLRQLVTVEVPVTWSESDSWINVR